jgi:NTP pyrophosphatase (non-canonical NTP hydrolase)
MTSFDLLRAKNTERQNHWDPDNTISAIFRSVELAGEVGEALNIVKKLERERMGIVGSRATIEDLAGELSDIIICADLVAMHYGISLSKAIPETFNKTSTKNGMPTIFALNEMAPTKIKVKPLNWLSMHEGIEQCADDYRILDRGQHWSSDRFLLEWRSRAWAKHATLSEAKGAARAHHEAIILAAIKMYGEE